MMSFFSMRAVLSLSLIALAAASPSPSQVHIALAGNDKDGNSNGMTVSWYTPQSTTTSTVQFGTDKSNLELSATGETISYLDTQYFYRCGDATSGWSDVISFKSAPLPDATREFSFSVFGDLGYGKNGHAVASRAQLENIKDEVDLVWHLGDVSYADDAFLHNPLSFEYENVFNKYMEDFQNISSTLPYQVMPGNHESECHSPICLGNETLRESLRNFTAYNARFRMPFKETKGTSNMWYSFNYGNVHFVSIDTETDYPRAPEAHHGDSGILPAGGFGADGEFLKWLENDLIEASSTANRALRPWILVGGHRPMYDASGVAGEIQSAFEELMHKYQIDVFFGGHIHSYARSLPVYKSQVASTSYDKPNATVYMVVGGAGCDEMDGLDPTGAAWNVASYDKYATGVLKVKGDTLNWQLIDSKSGAVQDSFSITK